MVHLTASQRNALVVVQEAWPEADLVLVGALALGCHIDMHYRATDDLDVAISVATEAFPGPLLALTGWTQDRTREHRFLSPDGQRVDIVPAGPAQIARGFVEWPSGEQMSLAGFDLAFEHSSDVDVGDSLTVRVILPRFRRQSHYAAIRVSSIFNSNSIGLT